MKPIQRAMFAALFILLVAAVAVQAQNVRRVNGKVTDSETGKPIEGVKITAYMVNQPNAKFEDITDKGGRYVITGLVPGLAAFHYEKIGYEPFQTTARLSSTATRITQDASLVRIARQEGMATPAISEKYNQGVELFQAGKLDEAMAIFEQLIKDYPDLYEVHLNIGIILQGKQDYEGALKHFNTALEHNPKNENALIYVAEVYLAQQNFEEALKWYIKAAEVRPDLYYVINQIADVARYLEKYDVAIEYYRKAIALDPSQAMPYLYLGTLLNLRDNYAGAIDALMKYVEVDTSGPAVSNSKAMIDTISEKWDGAAEHFGSLAAADDTRALAHYYLGKTLAYMGRNDEAKMHINRYLELDPDDKFGEQAAANELLSAM